MNVWSTADVYCSVSSTEVSPCRRTCTLVFVSHQEQANCLPLPGFIFHNTHHPEILTCVSIHVCCLCTWGSDIVCLCFLNENVVKPVQSDAVMCRVSRNHWACVHNWWMCLNVLRNVSLVRELYEWFGKLGRMNQLQCVSTREHLGNLSNAEHFYNVLRCSFRTVHWTVIWEPKKVLLWHHCKNTLWSLYL